VQNVEGLFGTGHHSLFTDKEGHMRIVFHAHHSTGTIHPRMMYIGTMDFEDNILTLTADSLIRPQLKDQTGIEAALLPSSDGKDTVFDTSGRRLTSDAAMLSKGVRIRNGRKELKN
jgi:hypothetical protein